MLQQASADRRLRTADNMVSATDEDEPNVLELLAWIEEELSKGTVSALRNQKISFGNLSSHLQSSR